MEETLVINIDGVVCVVRGNVDDVIEKESKFVKDCGYIKDGHVYIYGGKIKEKTEPGHFYKTAPDKYTYVPALNPDDNKTDKIKDIKKIKDDICHQDKLKEVEDIATDLADLHVFAPPIKDGDDQLKRLVKMALEKMQIDLKQFRSEFNKEYDLTNLKASVTKPAPMTMKYFLRWLEVLDLQCVISIDSKGTKSANAIREPISLIVE